MLFVLETALSSFLRKMTTYWKHIHMKQIERHVAADAERIGWLRSRDTVRNSPTDAVCPTPLAFVCSFDVFTSHCLLVHVCIDVCMCTHTGTETLVPLTSSLYVTGSLGSTETVLIDVGTGYFLEVRRWQYTTRSMTRPCNDADADTIIVPCDVHTRCIVYIAYAEIDGGWH